MNTWREVKDERIRLVGLRCEECHQEFGYDELIGHHVLPRKLVKKYRLYLTIFCRIRCPECERKMHRLYATGNDQETTAYLRSMLIQLERGVRDGYFGNR